MESFQHGRFKIRVNSSQGAHQNCLYSSLTSSHRDHFDRKVEESLRRSLPIITTPHAKSHLADSKPEGEAFTDVYALETFKSMIVDIDAETKESETKKPAMKVTAMPGEHVPPGVLGTMNDWVKAVSSDHFTLTCRKRLGGRNKY